MSVTGWPVPSAIASNSDATAQQIFGLANLELQNLSELLNWPFLEIEYPFSTVIDQAVYLWPDDFRVMLQQSIFNADEYYELKGSCGIEDWNWRKYGMLGNISRQAFRVQYPLGQPAIEIAPPPSQSENMIGVYYTKYFARDNTGASIPLYAQDTDISKIPELYVQMGLMWRFRRAKGLDFSVELAEYNNTIQAQYAKFISQAVVPVGGRRWQDDWPVTNGYVPDHGFG